MTVVYTFWVAEGEVDGKPHTIAFDTEPSVNDVRESCQDFDGDIKVFELKLAESSRKPYLNLNDYER
jgi:hypothetical protein